MNLRLSLSRLASAETRAAAARGLAVLCAIGFVLTMIVLVAAGERADQWFFILLVWALFVYVPLRILLEAAQTFAPALRRRLVAQAATQTERYASSSGIELMVDGLFEREVVMPRITTPVQRAKAKDGAVAVLAKADAIDGGVRGAAGDCLASVEGWVAHLGSWAANEGQNIQARWGEVRALAAMAAMTKVLIAAHEDRGGAAFGSGNGQVSDPAVFLDACLDYCDDLALEVDVTPWEERPLTPPLRPGRAEELRAAWKTFVDTGPPALEARETFVKLLFSR